MAHFFFHLITESERHEDEIGLELQSVEAAYLQAAAAACGMASELLAAGIDPSRCRFDITDADGVRLLSLEFAELLRRRARAAPQPAVATRLIETIVDTHRRVSLARREIAASLLQVRATLSESQALLARLDAMERD